MSTPLVVIAIGGNSLIRDAEHMTVPDQYQAAGDTSHHIAGIVKLGYRVLITHGNGPQVGFILLRSELARNFLHSVPLEVCVADTQGAIGYQVAQTLGNELRQLGMERPIAPVVTQVVVDANDPAFQNPSKPIGPFMTEEDAKAPELEVGWQIREDAGRGWRRVVASPQPLEIIELPAIRELLARDIIVIAAGGGGIPIVRDAQGSLQGVPAVIDKDQATALLARELGADIFMISTGVERVAIHYQTPQECWLDRITLQDAIRFREEGHFAPGSMLPKIDAAIDFLQGGGKHVIITSPEKIEEALQGHTGTHVFCTDAS